MSEGTKQRLVRRRAELVRERASWVPHWRELGDFFYPRRGRFLASNVNKGQKKNSNIINNTAIVARRTLAAGMMSAITSPARPWFKLAAADKDLNDFGPVRVWIEEVERAMRGMFNQSNFYDLLPPYYAELGVFGTAAMMQLDDFSETTRFYGSTVGEYYLATSARGNVNAFYRDVPMTVAHMVESFGLDAVSPSVRNLWDKGNAHAWVEVVHAIEPNFAGDEGASDSANMPFMSAYWEKADGSENGFLKRGGFRRFPVYATRWEVTPPDVYGASPGMDALGDAKALQTEEKQKAKAIVKMADPPMKGPTSLRRKYASVLPGDITYVDESQGAFTPSYQVDPRISELMVDIREVETRINRAMYVDLFLLLATSDRRDITAEEVARKHEERLLQLGPVVQRATNAMLAPLIDNSFATMAEAGLLPPPPPELEGTELEIEFVSLIAQAQQVVGISAIERTAGFVGGLAGAYPQALDKFNVEQSIEEFASAAGAPATLIVPASEIEANRQAKEEKEMQAMEAAAAVQVGSEVAMQSIPAVIGSPSGQAAADGVAQNLTENAGDIIAQVTGQGGQGAPVPGAPVPVAP